MEKLSSNILRFHRVNGKKLENWIIEAIQLNEYLQIPDEEVVKIAVEIAKNWNDRVSLMTHDNFLLAVDSKLRQKFASKIETQEYHRNEKTQEIVSNVQENTQRFLDPMCFDTNEVEAKYEEPYNNRT
jgi:hypothetical protein